MFCVLCFLFVYFVYFVFFFSICRCWSKVSPCRCGGDDAGAGTDTGTGCVINADRIAFAASRIAELLSNKINCRVILSVHSHSMSVLLFAHSVVLSINISFLTLAFFVRVSCEIHFPTNFFFPLNFNKVNFYFRSLLFSFACILLLIVGVCATAAAVHRKPFATSLLAIKKKRRRKDKAEMP